MISQRQRIIIRREQAALLSYITTTSVQWRQTQIECCQHFWLDLESVTTFGIPRIFQFASEFCQELLLCGSPQCLGYTPERQGDCPDSNSKSIDGSNAERLKMAVPQIVSGKTRIGWIGTGVMGSSMCGHLMTAGFAATVFSRTKEKAEALIGKGATWAASPKEVAQNSDVIFSIVGFPTDVRAVMLGDDGALAGAKAGSVLVDMTTSQPSLAVEIYEAAGTKGVHSVDAPVSGGDIGARNAALSIMIGGDADVVTAMQPLWEAMGKTIVHQGGAGAGQHTKMVNQILIATGMIGVCEALLYGYKSGLDLPTILKSVSSGAAGSWSLTNLGPRIIDNNFDPGFFVEHFIKDIGIALEESRRMGLSMPGLALAMQLYLAVKAQGFGRNGTHALMLALANLSGIDWRKRN